MNPEVHNILGINEITIPSKDDIREIVPIGSISDNGFVNKIKYSNNVTAILKSSQLKSSQEAAADNLYYEWFVGCSFINRLGSTFPCFCKTYSLCDYLNPVPHVQLQRRISMPGSILQRDVNFINACDITDANTIKSCTSPSLFGILMQDIPHAESFYNFARHPEQQTEYGLNVIMVQLLLQIYIPLGLLADQFTHYDLHEENVLIYTLPDNKYATLIYTIPTIRQTITMKTRYIAKIIDYGRCFFNNGVVSSANFYGNIHHNVFCTADKQKKGYKWFGPNRANLNSLVVNKSRDLWLVWLYKTSLTLESNRILNAPLKKLYKDIIIGNFISGYPMDPELTSCPDKICTVHQFMDRLCTYYDSNYTTIEAQNNHYVHRAIFYGTYRIDGVNINPQVAPQREVAIAPATKFDSHADRVDATNNQQRGITRIPFVDLDTAALDPFADRVPAMNNQQRRIAQRLPRERRGGKRKTNKRKKNKQKTNKRKRNKQKTNKQKTNKRC